MFIVGIWLQPSQHSFGRGAFNLSIIINFNPPHGLVRNDGTHLLKNIEGTIYG
jgi:hypothetical protein